MHRYVYKLCDSFYILMVVPVIGYSEIKKRKGKGMQHDMPHLCLCVCVCARM